jgi:NADH:ubiquinone oxidoreductase subunit 5 (subunit L)/multisubunit Na+/H+ antiporter MnhA subunit
MAAHQVLPLVVTLPFAAAALALALGRALGRWTGGLMALAAGASFVLALTALPEALGGAAPVFAAAWLPELGIGLRLRGDPFGLFFALLVAGVGALVAAYSVAYVPALPARRLGRYHAALAAFMGAMLGLVLADDLILFFVFWELTSVASYLLIGFWYERPDARAGAATALQVTAAGGLALLAGAILVGLATGTYSLAALAGDATVRAALAASPAGLPALVLLLVGAFTKSAQVPFHFWLPGAMVAPTPVSAYLHAATMVKAGIVLLARLLPIFGAHPAWAPVLVAVGLATFVTGAWQAFRASDLKAMLARTTVSALGLLTLGYGLGLSAQDALQILSHATYKGTLFLVVGIVEHATHTRDIDRLGGLRAALPLTFAVAVVAAASMAGLPPLLGFLAKEALYQGMLESAVFTGTPAVRALAIAAAVAANALTFAVALRLVTGVFLGPLRTRASEARPEPPGLWAPPAVLASLALGLGLLGGSGTTEALVNALSSDPHAHLHVALWPLHAGPALLSLATVALGVVLHQARARLVAPAAPLPDMQRAWDGALDAVYRFAVAYSTRWQNGSLRWYLSATLLFAVGLVAAGLGRDGVPLGGVPLALGGAPWIGIAVAALTVAAAVAVARATTRLAAALALTAVGLLVSLLFVVYRSPDIVLTQILIETVSTIFILLVLWFMPPFRRDGLSPGQTAWNVAVSTAVGGAMFALVLLCTAPTLRETRNLAADYLGRSLAEAGGANAVNVIIVDFRAMDTIGEITVLVVVALSVYGLLRARRPGAA